MYEDDLFKHGVPKSSPARAPQTPLAGARIELTDGTERIRALTDVRGRFSFPHLNPGSWILQVLAANPLPRHYIADDRVSLELALEASRHVEFQVLFVHVTSNVSRAASFEVSKRPSMHIPAVSIPGYFW